jgi:septal ring-binding cell division protein DamX
MKYTFLSVLLIVTVGCSSNKPAPTSNDAKTDKIPWFCQTGTDNNSWECVQNETLATNPQPQRLPEPRVSAPNNALPAMPPPQQPTRLQPDVTAAAPGIADHEAPVPAVSAPPALTPAPSKPADPSLPTHIALSYRPTKPVAILDLPKHFWAVQLVAVSTKEALEAYARNNKLAGMSAARVWDGAELYYVLLLGIYETRDNAEQAIASLDGPLQDLNAWIRSVGSLQQAMLEADRAAGTTEI